MGDSAVMAAEFQQVHTVSGIGTGQESASYDAGTGLQ